jgi:hypothetical protein
MSAENFTLTPSQFAKKERITVETLKKRRQRGFYDGKFQNVNGKYYYLERASYSRSSAGNPSSRFRRRGAHKEGLETKYPNAAFKEHNELKMLARIKHKLGPAVLDELTPEAIEVAQQNLLKKKKQRLESAINKKNYGGMLNASEYNLLLKKHRNRQNFLQFQRENNYDRGGSFYAFKVPVTEDNTTEVVPSSSNETPRFNNKIKEAIYYAKRRN